MNAEKRKDRRHWDCYKADPDMAIVTKREKGVNLVLNQVIRNIETEELWKAVAMLSPEDRLLVRYRYCDRLTMQEIGQILGISKMAVSKRHTKLLGRLRVMLSASSLLKPLLFRFWQYCRRSTRVTLAAMVNSSKPICYFSGFSEFRKGV